MKKIVLASNNQNKINEIKEILKDYEILSLKDIGYTDDIEETFEENSYIKAKTVFDYLKNNNEKMMVIADDSGLYCKGINNAPGVLSARYAGDHNNQANRDKLRKELQGKDRSAFFNCCITLIRDENDYEQFIGITEGEIIDEEMGKKDFGYDCIFLSKDLGKTFGEATEEEKNSVSHRRRALEKLKAALEK